MTQENPVPNITLPDARAILTPHMPKLAQAMSLSMVSLVACPPIFHIDMDNTANATVMHRFFLGNSRRLMESDNGVQFENLQGQNYIQFDEKVLLRFKRLDDAYLSRNYPTSQSISWNAQLPLETLPPVPRLEFGYIPDETWTRIDRAYILLRIRKTIVWLWQVWGIKDDTFAVSISGAEDMLGTVRYAYDNFENAI